MKPIQIPFYIHYRKSFYMIAKPQVHQLFHSIIILKSSMSESNKQSLLALGGGWCDLTFPCQILLSISMCSVDIRKYDGIL